LVLINSILSSIVLYMISFFHLRKGVLQELDYFLERFFFWQNNSVKKKHRLAKYTLACGPKDEGGLGIHDLEV
jgi:hypothetical protein